MSRRPMATVELMLGPAGIDAVGPSAATSRSELAITVDTPAADVQAAVGEAVGSALASAGTPPRGGWPAHVVLDDRLCWLDIVEGDFASQPERVIRTLMQASVEEVFGEAAASQALRWQVQADGRHALLLAVPEPLLRAVQDALASHQATLVRMEPAFARAWNAAAPLVDLRDGVVAWLRAGQGIFVHMRRGSMAALGREPAEQTAAELNQSVRRLLSRYGDAVDEHTLRVLLTDGPVDGRLVAPWQARQVALVYQGAPA